MIARGRFPLLLYLLLLVLVSTLLLAAVPARASVATPGTLLGWSVHDSATHQDDSYATVGRAPDGSTYAAGQIGDDHAGGGDFFVCKWNAGRIVQWTRSWTSLPNAEDYAVALAVDRFGNVIVAGASYLAGEEYDISVVKWAADGTERWATTYSGNAHGSDMPEAVVVDRSGNAYVCGSSDGGADAIVLKFAAADGHQMWAHFISGTAVGDSRALAMIIDRYGALYVTGNRPMNGHLGDCFVAKLGPGGANKWLRGYDGAAHQADGGDAIRLGGGAVYVAGTTRTLATLDNLLLLKYSTAGRRRWARRWDGTAHDDDTAKALGVDGHGNAYVAGWSWAGTPKYKAVLVKWSDTGSRRWVRSYYDVPTNGRSAFEALTVDGKGRCWAAGWVLGPTCSEWLVAKYSSGGARGWVRRWAGPETLDTRIDACVSGALGTLFVAGSSTSAAGATDAIAGWYVK